MVRASRAALSAFALALLLVAAAHGQEDQSAARHQVFGLPGAGLDLPFSGGVMAGDLLYLSGAIGNRPGEMTVSGTPAEQAVQALANLESVLAAAGLDKSNLVSTTVYVSDLRLYPGIGRALATALSDDKRIAVAPTRTVVEADIAVPGAVIEIAAVAALPAAETQALVPAGWPSPTTGYSWGVRAGDTVFVAGQAGLDLATGRRTVGIDGQTRQTVANIASVLGAAGLGLEHLVACRVYLPDARSFAEMNEAWRVAFDGVVPPTRATIRGRLPDSALDVVIQCQAERGAKKVVSLPGEATSRLPFSPAIAVGDRLYLSGFVGRGADGYAGGLDAQTGVVLDRVAAHLAQAGMSFEDVVSAEVWLDDVRHYQAMNEIYAGRLPAPRPARATVASRLMSPEARVEIAMIAVKRSRPKE